GYEIVVVAVQTDKGWVVANTLFENENSGCCGAYREFAVSFDAFRDVAPGLGAEVLLRTEWTDQDSDMGDDMIYQSVVHATHVCGVDHGGTPWCRAFPTREMQFSGNLTKFLDGEIDG